MSNDRIVMDAVFFLFHQKFLQLAFNYKNVRWVILKGSSSWEQI